MKNREGRGAAGPGMQIDTYTNEELDDVIHSTTSSDILSSAADILTSGSDAVSTYLDRLKGGTILSPASTDFRKRRLTYAQRTIEHVEAPSPISVKRTTIYTSAERGVKQIKLPPFPGDVLGTYSCHGIEPSTSYEPGEEPVHDKTNQDRGCVVNPFCNSSLDTLLLVLDGHGEQGDRVSEFVMRQVCILFVCLLSFLIFYLFDE